MTALNKQALREAAEKATGAHDRLSVMPADDIFDISLHEGTQLDADITDLNAFNEAANPAAVLALLDELEAAEKRNVELSMLLEGADDIQTDYAEALECQDDNDAVLAAIVALKQRAESAEKHIAELRDWNLGLAQESLTHQQRIAELSGQKRLIGWRASDYTDETSDHELAKNWAAAIGVLPIFEGDVNTKLSAAGISKGE